MAINQSSCFNEQQWVIQIRRILEEDHLDGDDDIYVSIAAVPKPLLQCKPESYTPQLISIGPYHHHREELRETERYKVFAAKKLHHNVAFTDIVNIFTDLAPATRAHYHRYLSISSETLAWMMAMDSSFLLEFLLAYSGDEKICNHKSLQRITSRLTHLVDRKRRKSIHNMILRDIFMLENQIPLFLLRKILELQCSSSRVGDELLFSSLIGLLKDISPFKNMDISVREINVSKYSHILELLYRTLVPTYDEDYEEIEAIENNEQSDKEGFIMHCSRLFACTAMKFLVKIPWSIISNLPFFTIIKKSVENLPLMERSSASDMNTPPLMEEITIPSVTELACAGIKFSPTTGDLATINFDRKTSKFQLPAITIDVNSEVVFRNLVAYETSIVSGPLIFTRYIELMNGIIDDEEDVKILRRSGAVFNRLKNDKEVAELWNGMSRSVRLTRVAKLDAVIEDVNEYYNKNNYKIRLRRFMNRYVYASWQFLVLLTVVVLVMGINFQVLLYGFRMLGNRQK